MAQIQSKVTVSLPSGACCTVALAPDSRVQHMQPAIERSLKVPRCVQRLLAGSGDTSKEIHPHQTLREAGLDNGGSVTLLRAWPEDDDDIVRSIEEVANAKRSHNVMVATAVAELLDRDSPSVVMAAIRGLSWMDAAGTEHASKVANLLTCQANEPVKHVAAEALAWMGTEGAAHARAIALWCSDGGQLKCYKARHILRDMFWSEDRKVAQAALNSFAQGSGDYSTEFFSRDSIVSMPSCLVSMPSITEFFEEACFDSDCSIRQAASSALSGLVRGINRDASGNFILLMIKQLSNFGALMLKSKSCNCSVGELGQTLAPVVAAISSAADGARSPVQAETKSAKRVIYQVRVATVGLIARVFHELNGYEQNSLLSYISSDCVHNKAAQMRIASIRWLIDNPRGVGAAMSVARLKRNERKQEVLAVVDTYFEAYAESVDLSSSGAVSTGTHQFSTGVQDDCDDSGYYDSGLDWGADEAVEWADDWDSHHDARGGRANKGSHGGHPQKTPTDKSKLRKAAEWKEASTAVEKAHEENAKVRDRRRNSNRDDKAAAVGRLLLSSSLG